MSGSTAFLVKDSNIIVVVDGFYPRFGIFEPVIAETMRNL